MAVNLKDGIKIQYSIVNENRRTVVSQYYSQPMLGLFLQVWLYLHQFCLLWHLS